MLIQHQKNGLLEIFYSPKMRHLTLHLHDGDCKIKNQNGRQ
jgi:hypothetical protein